MEVYQNEQGVEDVVPLEQWDLIYHVRLGHPRTEVTTAFLSPANLLWLMDCISRETGRLLNRDHIIIIPNNAFFNYAVDLLRGVHNLPDVARTVRDLNEMVLRNEANVQYQGLRRRELYFKWFIFKDRPRVIEPPLNTQGRNREIPLSNADYALTSPFSRWHADFVAKQRSAYNPYAP